jgi:hypothetical protein
MEVYRVVEIWTKNHETIFSKYYRKLETEQNWSGIFRVFLQFPIDFQSLIEKEKEK